jgi:hypothetical protein
MTRRHWRIVAGFLGGSVASLVVTVLALATFGPKPGAPEHERTLAIGPLWLSRLEASEPAQGVHMLMTVTNVPALILVSAVAGVVCAVVAGSKAHRKHPHEG